MLPMNNKQSLIDSRIEGVQYKGLTVKTKDGRPAMLAIVDADGNVIESGERVAKEAWNVTLAAFKRFVEGKGQISSGVDGIHSGESLSVANSR